MKLTAQSCMVGASTIESIRRLKCLFSQAMVNINTFFNLTICQIGSAVITSDQFDRIFKMTVKKNFFQKNFVIKMYKEGFKL